MPKRKTKPARRRNVRGQVLLFALLALLVLLMAILFIFDLQHAVRVKVKSQTIVDAAALAAGRWQTDTLNLIGELNLIKACTVLASDIDPAVTPLSWDAFVALSATEQEQYIADQRDALLASADALTESQCRLSFAGPLIGFGAAQQAAKNNGAPSNEGYNDVVRKHLERLSDDDIYGDPPLSQTIEGYAWRQPYIAMIDNILTGQGGIAVAPNTIFHGAPKLSGREPYISYLQDKHVFEAIQADYWCYIRDLIRTLNADALASGKWWGDIAVEFDSSSFPRESEYIPLDIEYFTGRDPFTKAGETGAFAQVLANRDLTLSDGEDFYRKNADGGILRDAEGRPIRNANDADNLVDVLPYITWAVYGSSWEDNAPSDKWTDAYYLRSETPPEHIYGGAVAKFTVESPISTMSGVWNSEKSASQQESLGDALAFSDQKYDETSFDALGTRLANAEEKVREGLSPVKASALAKPIGGIYPEEGDPKPPHAASMVLPVFTKTTLVPVAMGDPGGLDPFDYQWYAFLTEYLPTLGTLNRIEDMGPDVVPYPEHWSWFTQYHQALLKLNDPAWRQTGINWLEAEATGQDVLDANGNVIGHITLTTNEDHCDEWPSGGGGHRDGPDILH